VAEDETPRSLAQRISDALARLENDEDVWVASAGGDRPWLIPLSFHWTGQVLLLATGRDSPTHRNALTGGVRLALGHTRDVVMLDGDVDVPETLPEDQAEVVARVTGVDPRGDEDGVYLRFTPRRIQAWRTYEETLDRTIMRDGRWVTDPAS
jgi:hypothetical protein